MEVGTLVLVIFWRMLLSVILKLRSNEGDLAISVPTIAPPLIPTHKGMGFSRRVYKHTSIEVNGLPATSESLSF